MDPTIIGILAGALVVLVVIFIAMRSRGAKNAGQAKTEASHPSAPFPIPEAPPPSSRVPSPTPAPSSRPPALKKEEPPAPPSDVRDVRPPEPVDLRSKSEPPSPLAQDASTGSATALDRLATQPPGPPDPEPVSVEPISMQPATSDAPPALEDDDEVKTELRQSQPGAPVAGRFAESVETVKPPAMPPPPARPSDRQPVQPRVSEPRAPVAAPKPATPVTPIEAKKPEPPKQEPPKPEPVKAKDEHDFSALNEPAKPKIEKAASAARPAYVPPSNPATAALEKSDPRHASARRFARVAVSEIKLYHEAEVKAGREAKDLWTRLSADIGLAKQTYEQRVDKEVRERFDYLYDEIVRQLAEGDLSKLGPEAPKPSEPKLPAVVDDAKTTAPAVTKRAAEAAPARRAMPEEPPTKKIDLVAEAPPAKPVEAPKPVAAPPPAEGKATMPGVTPQRYVAPTSPATAELEKSDPRHASARRFARVAVSEIKLYHEAEVKAGREAKDLWTRLSADIGLAKQTYEARVDKEVRERFDYLYDEILRQLAEGDVSKLGPEAPKKEDKKPSERNVAAAAPAAAPVVEEKKISERKVPVAEPVAPPVAPPPAAEPAKEEPKPAPAPVATAAAIAPTQPSAISKYLPPSNPATAELEKSDPRHAAARRLARLSVSEIKLYHEDEVKAGREAKDLWKRLSVDIGLATQTYEKRVDKEVRERFDYLYDEILRQLAEGDADKLGPEAPKGRNAPS
jgi:hypothetical protein